MLMCGEIETDESIAEEFYARFVDHARSFLAASPSESPDGDDSELYDYLEAMFRDTLRATTEAATVGDAISGFERLCMEPLVYARVAGFMAAHQPIEDDPLRRLIEALMTGYAEGEEAAAVAQHHDHGHSHEHTH
jgi:hypothetical protein